MLGVTNPFYLEKCAHIRFHRQILEGRGPGGPGEEPLSWERAHAELLEVMCLFGRGVRHRPS